MCLISPAVLILMVRPPLCVSRLQVSRPGLRGLGARLQRRRRGRRPLGRRGVVAGREPERADRGGAGSAAGGHAERPGEAAHAGGADSQPGGSRGRTQR